MAFNYDDFRANEGLRLELAQFLRSDCGLVLMRVMRNHYKPADVPSTTDALVSARILSQYHGAHACLDDIEAIIEPIIRVDQVPATYDAADSDHDRFPSDDELKPQIRVNFPPETEPPQ